MEKKNPVLEAILEQIYGGGMNEGDLAMIIRKIHQRLEDPFYEDPPSITQLLTLKALLGLADEVEGF